MTMTGTEIRERRNALGISMQELATRAGMSFVALQHIETGKTQHPHKMTLRVLEMTLAEFERGDDAPAPM